VSLIIFFTPPRFCLCLLYPQHGTAKPSRTCPTPGWCCEPNHPHPKYAWSQPYPAAGNSAPNTGNSTADEPDATADATAECHATLGEVRKGCQGKWKHLCLGIFRLELGDGWWMKPISCWSSSVVFTHRLTTLVSIFIKTPP